MSRTAVKIETGLFGLALILAIIFWSTGFADNSNQTDVRYYGGQISPRMLQLLQYMREEIGNVSKIMIAEPNRIIFMNKAGETVKYHYAYQTLWRNDYPLILDIQNFHFEYRNQAGHSLGIYKQELTDVNDVLFVMQFKKQNKNVIANGRIHIRPTYVPTKNDVKNDVMLVNAN